MSKEENRQSCLMMSGQLPGLAASLKRLMHILAEAQQVKSSRYGSNIALHHSSLRRPLLLDSLVVKDLRYR